MAILKAASTICCHGTSGRQAELNVLPSDRLRNVSRWNGSLCYIALLDP